MPYHFPDRLDIANSPSGEFLTTYLRGLTHKLNNMLAVFQGFTTLTLMSDGLSDSDKENLTHMKVAAQNGSQLTEKIVASGGCAKLDIRPIVLSELLPMIDRTLREPFQKLGVPFELRVDPQLGTINVDSGRFREILVELLRNAAEGVRDSGVAGEASMEIYGPGHSPEGTQGRIDFFVHNTGMIREDRMKEVFKAFATTKDGSHFGIGLTLAAVLAHQMGMDIGIKSENGRTTAWLSVPVMAVPTAA